MIHNDLKFFTNEPDRDLYTRFATILKSNTQCFDVLVGYFRASGFFKLYESLEAVEKIRILVGLNVDRFTMKVIDQASNDVQFASISSSNAKEAVSYEVEKEFADSNTSEKIEKGVRVFIDWLKSGKLELRIYTEAPIHAKVYIMRKDPDKVPDTFGTVITGSSNFSEAGLINNLELNVELKDYGDVKFALDKFEELWAKAIDIKETYVDVVEQKTWIRNDITPYQLYLKTLYEFFKEEINSDKENIETLLPEGYMRLQYQIDAVMQARKKLEAYNGVFISDVVGLGKTYISAMLANTFPRNAYKLVICPPVLVDNWKQVLQEFDVSRWDVESLGKLDRILEKNIDKYTYVFVDEAHRFRNSGTDAFTKLHQICRGKKVILISATPMNNYTSDIENQLYLFQSKHNGTINGIKNLEDFFRSLRSKLNEFPKGTNGYMLQLRENAESIRDKLLREVMIRRTRGEIKKYYSSDLEKQGLTFPAVGKPEKIIYAFDEATEEAFNETMQVIRQFKYARYTPLLYLRDKKKYATMLTSQKNMGGFMKGILVKRLESSFYAFKKTLDRFILSYEKFINMVKSGDIYISKDVDAYDLLDDGNLEKLMYFVEQNEVMKFKSTDFEARFIKDLENDIAQLKSLQTIWSFINVDPKLDEFVGNLTRNTYMKDKKIIIFTESRETAEYLCDNLKAIYSNRVIYYSGQSSAALKIEIEDSFNPRFTSRGEDKYDILITTDVLAEGINLHRANVLVNYDLPWNPTRIMQRVGRINRVGTEFDEIHVFNFFPTTQSNAQVPMEQRILEKIQSFHDTLGEDIKYLSEKEEVSAKNLFDDLNKNLDGDDESGNNPELAYLAIIRQIRDDNPELFSAIKRLPRKAKTGKESMLVETDSTISFIKKGALKTFFITDSNKKSKQLPFIEAIKLLESNEEEKKKSIGKMYYDQFGVNNIAFDDMLLEDKEATASKMTVAGNDAKIIKTLKAIKKEPTLTDIQEANINKLIELWSDGEIPSKISKDIMKKVQLAKDVQSLYFDILNTVPKTYFEEKKVAKSPVDGEKQVILSCYLASGGNNEYDN